MIDGWLEWRKRRLLQAESAEIQSEKKFNSRAAERARQERGEAAIQEISTIGKNADCLNDGKILLALGRAVELLESLEASIELRGFDPKNDPVTLNKVFGTEGKHVLPGLYVLGRDYSIAAGVADFKEFDLPPDARKAKFLDCLRYQINDLKRSQKKLNKSAEEREALESQSSCVPEPARLDRLLRYGASLQRDYDRCLNQLERLQRARKGQPPLPMLKVDVSH